MPVKPLDSYACKHQHDSRLLLVLGAPPLLPWLLLLLLLLNLRIYWATTLTYCQLLFFPRSPSVVVVVGRMLDSGAQ
jgi:hypothetical protein